MRTLQHRALGALVAVLFVGGCASAGGPGAEPTQGLAARGPACAQIFSTNDTHGRLLPSVQSWSEGRLVGGSAVLAGYANEARAAEPECPVFIVSGGDIMQGTLISNLSLGESTIAAFEAIGYDAVAIGNHEFDWGVDVLKDRIAQADFAMLGANIFLKGTNDHPDWIEPWTIVEKNGVRVGIIGMITLSTPTTTKPVNVVDFDFRPINEALDRYIPIVRAQGVDFVVAAMHEGGFCDVDNGCHGHALEALAATTEPFDYAVTGHTHSRIMSDIRGVPVVQSYSNTTGFGLGRLERTASGEVRAELVDVVQTYADQVTPDPDVAMVVDNYWTAAADGINRIVVTLPEPLTKPRRGDHALGRIIADAQRLATSADVALMNNGGVRRPLPAGDITYGELFELQPFGNMLVRLDLSGAALLEALEHSGRGEGMDLLSSGITATYDADAPVGSRVSNARLDNGDAIDPDATYLVTVNDFLAMGGGGYTMFQSAPQDHTGLIDLDALVEYLESEPAALDLARVDRWIAPTP